MKSHQASVEGLEARMKDTENNGKSAKIEVRELENRHATCRGEVDTLNNQRNKLQRKTEQLENVIREAENEQFLGTGDNFETLVYVSQDPRAIFIILYDCFFLAVFIITFHSVEG